MIPCRLRPSHVRQRLAEARESDRPTPRESPPVDYDRLRRELDHRRVVSSRHPFHDSIPVPFPGPASVRRRTRSGPAAGPTQDTIPVHGRAQRLNREQPQVNHLAEQSAVLPGVRAEHALMNLRGSLFYAPAAAPIRPSAETEELRLHS